MAWGVLTSLPVGWSGWLSPSWKNVYPPFISALGAVQCFGTSKGWTKCLTNCLRQSCQDTKVTGEVSPGRGGASSSAEFPAFQPQGVIFYIKKVIYAPPWPFKSVIVSFILRNPRKPLIWWLILVWLQPKKVQQSLQLSKQVLKGQKFLCALFFFSFLEYCLDFWLEKCNPANIGF